MDCDFLVIGGGIAGASVAYELAAQGQVLLLEREEQPGYHSTGRSAATLTEVTDNPLVWALTAASRPFYAQPPGGFSEAPLLQARGLLLIAHADQRASLERRLGEAARFGAHVERLGQDAAIDAVPLLDPAYVDGALFEPAAVDMDVHAILQGFIKGLRARGGQLQTLAEVTGLERVDRAWRVRTADALIATRVVVNAAGAWADHIARLAGVAPIGLQPLRRTGIILKPPANLDVQGWPMVKCVDETFYVKPDAGRLLASPADETPSPAIDVRPDERDVAVCVDRIERATTWRIARVEHRWAGLRSFAPDRNPVVGPTPAAPGFVWLAGQGGFGIETAPAMARAAAALAMEQPLAPELSELGVRKEALAPDRL